MLTTESWHSQKTQILCLFRAKPVDLVRTENVEPQAEEILKEFINSFGGNTEYFAGVSCNPILMIEQILQRNICTYDFEHANFVGELVQRSMQDFEQEIQPLR